LVATGKRIGERSCGVEDTTTREEFGRNMEEEAWRMPWSMNKWIM
jgi:hypothetical protein